MHFSAITNGRESEGTWFAIGSIYPALEPAFNDNDSSVPLSDIIEEANQTNTPQEEEFTEADRVPLPNESKLPEQQQQQPQNYTLDDFESFLQRVNTGDLSASELQADFARLYSNREGLTQQLVAEKSAKELKILALTIWLHGRKTEYETTKRKSMQSVQ